MSYRDKRPSWPRKIGRPPTPLGHAPAGRFVLESAATKTPSAVGFDPVADAAQGPAQQRGSVGTMLLASTQAVPQLVIAPGLPSFGLIPIPAYVGWVQMFPRVVATTSIGNQDHVGYFNGPSPLPPNTDPAAVLSWLVNQATPIYTQHNVTRENASTLILGVPDSEGAPVFLPPGQNVAVFTGDLSTYVTAVLADAPLVYWRLGEQSGATANDASGNSRIGSYAGGITYGDTSTPVLGDSAVRMSNTSSVVTSAAASTAFDTTDFTLECLLKPAWQGFDGPTPIIATLGDAATFRWTIALDTSAALKIRVGGGGAFGPVLGVSMPNSSWTHLAVVYTNATTNWEVFINGVSVGSVVFARGAQTNKKLFAGNAGAGGNSWGASSHGASGIDEVALYGTALSAARILAHFNAMTTGANVSCYLTAIAAPRNEQLLSTP